MTTTEFWTMLTAIGTIGATVLALLPIIKENWRKLWLKIYSAEIALVLSDPTNFTSASKLNLILGITNRTPVDIGLQLTYVWIYKKRPNIFSRRPEVHLCFGSRKRHPNHVATRFESNEYFLDYDNSCITTSLDELQKEGIPQIQEIMKIKIELKTTVGSYNFTVSKKYWNNITSNLLNYKFPTPGISIKTS